MTSCILKHFYLMWLIFIVNKKKVVLNEHNLFYHFI